MDFVRQMMDPTFVAELVTLAQLPSSPAATLVILNNLFLGSLRVAVTLLRQTLLEIVLSATFPLPSAVPLMVETYVLDLDSGHSSWDELAYYSNDNENF